MIEQIQELNFPDYATLSSATVALQDMGDKTITSTVKIDGDITPDFSKDWWIIFKGEHYFYPLRQPQASKSNDSALSQFDLTFEHWAIYQLKRWYFFSVVDMEAGTVLPDQYVVPISLTLGGFCDLLAKVLKYYFYDDSITVDLNPEWEYSQEPARVDINHSYIWDVLIKLYELYAVRWEIIRDPLTDPEDLGEIGYIIRVGYPAEELTHVFKHGFEGGLLKVERQVQDDNIRNMIYGRGGNRNIPYRYFKDVDPKNPAFPADPDWVPELRDMYFTELRGKTFRDYVKGWKTNPHRRLTQDDGTPITPYPHNGTVSPIGVEDYDEEYAEGSFAYQLGHTDGKFTPVEYVADKLIVQNGRVVTEPGSSINVYGRLPGHVDNNSDIYPTIQGVTVDGLGEIDEVIEVQQIESDDVEQAVEGAAKTTELPISGMTTTVEAEGNGVGLLTIKGASFSVGEGLTANFDPGALTMKGMSVPVNVGFLRLPSIDVTSSLVFQKSTIRVFMVAATPENPDIEDVEVSSIGMTEGDYYFTVELQIKNTYKRSVYITGGYEHPKLTTVEAGKRWVGTFNVWIKNIFNSRPIVLGKETPGQYAERIWRPILGDREGNEAKVMFTSGALSVSEEYEFVITETPQLDQTKELIVRDSDGHIRARYESYWRLTLAKSDTDLESTGLYVPNTRRQGNAGDNFLFIGVDMPHEYVLWAEENLDGYKTDALNKVSRINPAWVVTTDRVRFGNEGRADALIDKVRPGCSAVLRDEQFIDGGHEVKLYIQSVTYTYREPTSDDTGLNPDVEIVFSDKYETVANPVSLLQGEVSSISRQIGAISNVEQIVRAVGDSLYLRKDGLPARSMSPTEFASLLTSMGFRSGIVGGAGWGFFKDENGKWVLETDRLNVRQDMQVNTLVINQVEGRGGMTIESAASMEVTRVDDTPDGYVCYFDQKGGTVANLFHVGDVAYCSRFTPENGSFKFYKRRVTAVGAAGVTLARGDVFYPMPDGTLSSCVIGDGAPEEGDRIIHYGSYTDATRQFVKVRDVIGGGYERYIEGLDSVDSDGVEYYFVGRQAGMYNGRPRYYIGDSGGYVEWVDGKLRIKGELSVLSTIDGKTIDKYIGDKIDESGIAYTIDLSNEVAGVACDSQGNPLPGALPTTVAVVYDRDKVDSGWVFSAVFTNCSGMVNVSSGEITITGLDSGKDVAGVVVTATKGEYALSAAMSIYKVRPGADGKSPKVYSIGVSAGSVVRSADGKYDPVTILATKYLTTGAAAREKTSEKILERQFIYPDGSSTTSLLSGEGGPSEVSIPVAANCSAILLSLYDNDGNTLLDRERIPVIADASGLEVGGVNLLRGTEFKEAGGYWRFGSHANIDTGKKLNGHNSVKISAAGLTENAFYGITQSADENGDLAIAGGAWVTLSCWAFVDNTSALDAPARLEIQYKNGSARVGSKAVDIIPAENQRWQRFSLSVQVPDGCDSVLVYIYIVRNGDIWVSEPQLEKGNMLTQWSASPKDFDYLTAALQENSSTTGGLILASLMKLGYTEVDGEYRHMSGISGVYNPAVGARGGLAVWTGGDQIDPDLSPADPKRARAGLRHDGSAFFADNMMRIVDKRLELGANLIVDDRGMTLETDGGVNLEIRNESVGDGSAEISPIATIVAARNVTPDLAFYADQPASQPGGLTPQSSGALLFESEDNVLISKNIEATLPVGSIVRFKAAVGFTVHEPDLFVSADSQELPAIKCSILRDGETYATFYGQFRYNETESTSYLSSYKAEVNVNIKVADAGLYSLKLQYENPLPVGNRLSATSQVVSTAVNGSAIKTYENRTVLGNNGFISVWGDGVLFVNAARTVIRHGNCGLGVDASGFCFTEDGENWKRWKPGGGLLSSAELSE